STVHLEAGRIVLAAAAGERNRVVVTPAPPGGTLISDAAGLRPTGSGCAAVNATSVRCLAQGRLEAHLGDRDDSFDASAYSGPVQVTGGPGADTITGGSGADELRGDLDRQSAQGGADRLTGNGGDDAIYGGAGNDVIAGGAGDDVMGGAQGRDVEDGGPGDDQLDDFGIDGDPTAAPAGADTLRGGPGRDEIHAVTRGDRVSAGPGDNDVVAVSDSGEDNRSSQVVDCGAGRDEVEVGSRDDVTDCERPVFERLCSPGPRCQVHWVVTAGRRVVGRGSTHRLLGLRLSCPIALNAAGRRLARRPGGVTLGVSTQLRSGRTLFAPRPAISGLRVRLRSPG
ncbi:MAG TPA: calcium-binding protein, partial [Solirubrobacteraceae bacterium]